MYFELKDATADILARSRRHEELCGLPLRLIGSESEAYEIQAAAQDALGFDRKGYAVVGSSESSQRTLCLTSPIFSEIPASSLLTGAKEFRLPPGTIGVQCEFVFTMMRPYPDLDGRADLDSARDAILTCRPAWGILGRRANRSLAGNNAAIADFGLHVATLCGDHVPLASFGEFAAIDVTTFLFKETRVSGKASSVMGDPVNSVVWLARQLAARGRRLEPNDVVASGSCTTILQVLAGQHVAADFGLLGQVDCVFS